MSDIDSEMASVFRGMAAALSAMADEIEAPDDPPDGVSGMDAARYHKESHDRLKAAEAAWKRGTLDLQMIKLRAQQAELAS